MELEGSDSSYAARKVKCSICEKIIWCPVILSNLGLKKTSHYKSCDLHSHIFKDTRPSQVYSQKSHDLHNVILSGHVIFHCRGRQLRTANWTSSQRKSLTLSEEGQRSHQLTARWYFPSISLSRERRKVVEYPLSIHQQQQLQVRLSCREASKRWGKGMGVHCHHPRCLHSQQKGSLPERSQRRGQGSTPYPTSRNLQPR